MDKIHEDIGSLKSSVENINDRLDASDARGEKNHDLLVLIKDSISDFKTANLVWQAECNLKLAAAHTRIDEQKKSTDEKISLINAEIEDSIKPKLAFHELVIGRAIWVGTGIVSLITLVLNFAPQIISRFL